MSATRSKEELADKRLDRRTLQLELVSTYLLGWNQTVYKGR
jgi:hypothetical protein